mmetsp:Transcript_103570/g.259732  ORF Transcript_103570/g.259732 Transcript_103570/m.259732 type:complete len:206 (+) Transcript_103570:1449-2066(+)
MDGERDAACHLDDDVLLLLFNAFQALLLSFEVLIKVFLQLCHEETHVLDEVVAVSRVQFLPPAAIHRELRVSVADRRGWRLSSGSNGQGRQRLAQGLPSRADSLRYLSILLSSSGRTTAIAIAAASIVAVSAAVIRHHAAELARRGYWRSPDRQAHVRTSAERVGQPLRGIPSLEERVAVEQTFLSFLAGARWHCHKRDAVGCVD